MHAFVYINTERYKISNWLLHGNDKIQFARQINIALYIFLPCVFFEADKIDPVYSWFGEAFHKH